MLRFGVLLIYLNEIKLCINLVLHFVSNATFTHVIGTFGLIVLKRKKTLKVRT